ncbi:MAG: hypothetical protein R3B71_03865 [Candidatus Gracilibacteria bacterium]
MNPKRPNSYPIGRLKPSSSDPEESTIRPLQKGPDSNVRKVRLRQQPDNDSPVDTLTRSFNQELEAARKCGVHPTRTSVRDLLKEHPQLEDQLTNLRAFKSMAEAATTAETKKVFLRLLQNWLEQTNYYESLALLFTGRLVTHDDEEWRIYFCSPEDLKGENPTLTLVQGRYLPDQKTIWVSIVDIFAGLEIGQCRICLP